MISHSICLWAVRDDGPCVNNTNKQFGPAGPERSAGPPLVALAPRAGCGLRGCERGVQVPYNTHIHSTVREASRHGLRSAASQALVTTFAHPAPRPRPFPTRARTCVCACATGRRSCELRRRSLPPEPPVPKSVRGCTRGVEQKRLIPEHVRLASVGGREKAAVGRQSAHVGHMVGRDEVGRNLKGEGGGGGVDPWPQRWSGWLGGGGNNGRV